MYQRKRILCIDDDEHSRSLLAIILHPALVEAVPLDDAATGLNLSDTFDLYILDGILNGSPGERLCKEIRALDITTPIIIFSGRSLPEYREAALAAGASAYVLKPDLNELRRTVRQTLHHADRSQQCLSIQWSRVAQTFQL